MINIVCSHWWQSEAHVFRAYSHIARAGFAWTEAANAHTDSASYLFEFPFVFRTTFVYIFRFVFL